MNGGGIVVGGIIGWLASGTVSSVINNATIVSGVAGIVGEMTGGTITGAINNGSVTSPTVTAASLDKHKIPHSYKRLLILVPLVAA